MSFSTSRLGSVALVLLAAACSSASDDPASSTSDVTTPKVARVIDARTTPRFFREHGAEATQPVDVGGRSFFFGRKGIRTPNADAGAPSERWLYETTGTAARPVARTDDANVYGSAVAMGGAMYFIDGYAAGHESVMRTDDVAGVKKVGLDGTIGSLLVGGDAVYALERTSETLGYRLSRITRAADGSDVVASLWEGVSHDLGGPSVRANDAGVALVIDGQLLFAPVSGALTPVATPNGQKSLVLTRSRLFFTQSGHLFEVADDEVRDLGGLREARSVTDLGGTPVFIDSAGIQTIVGDQVTTIWPTALPAMFPATVLNGRLYVLTQSGEIYESDGTAAGTKRIATGLDVGYDYTNLVGLGTDLYFLGGKTSDHQLQRFSLATLTKTTLTSFPHDAHLRDIAVVGTSLMFSAGGSDADEMWTYTNGQASMIETNPYGNQSSKPVAFAATKTHGYFTTEDDVSSFDAPSYSLWATNGTPGGTHLVSSGQYPAARLNHPEKMLATVGARLCILESALGESYVCTNGVAPAVRYAAADHVAPIAFKNGLLLATVRPTGEKDIVSLDGALGTATVLATLPAQAVVRSIVPRANDVLFVVDAADAATKGVWLSDGTAAGTSRTNPDTSFALQGSRSLGSAGDLTYYCAGGSVFPTDGTPNGTSPGVKVSFDCESVDGNAAKSAFVVRANGKVWGFQGGTGAMIFGAVYVFGEGNPYEGMVAFNTGHDMLLTDGTVAGTTLISELGSGPRTKLPRGGLLVSVDIYEPSAHYLAVIDKTGRKTVLEDALFAEREMVTTPTGVVFDAVTPANGHELFFSFGTIHSARLLDEVRPGASSSNPHDLFSFGEQVLFTATDKDGDEELYTITPSL